MTPSMPWGHIIIAAALAFVSSTTTALFVSTWESTIIGFSVGALYLFSLDGKAPKIPIGVKNHEVRSQETK